MIGESAQVVPGFDPDKDAGICARMRASVSGVEEEQADCFAVERGQRLGWLTLEGLDEVCQIFADAKINKAHYGGVRRCQAMRECYAGASSQ